MKKTTISIHRATISCGLFLIAMSVLYWVGRGFTSLLLGLNNIELVNKILGEQILTVHPIIDAVLRGERLEYFLSWRCFALGIMVVIAQAVLTKLVQLGLVKTAHNPGIGLAAMLKNWKRHLIARAKCSDLNSDISDVCVRVITGSNPFVQNHDETCNLSKTKTLNIGDVLGEEACADYVLKLEQGKPYLYCGDEKRGRVSSNTPTKIIVMGEEYCQIQRIS